MLLSEDWPVQNEFDTAKGNLVAVANVLDDRNHELLDVEVKFVARSDSIPR